MTKTLHKVDLELRPAGKLGTIIVAGSLLAGCTNAVGVTEQTFETTANDGGSAYYAQFANPLPDDPNYFPVAVWHESLMDAQDAVTDRSFGINTYVELTTESNPTFAHDAGSYVLSSTPQSSLNGFVLPDEVDMWGKSGEGVWTGAWPGEAPICEPEESRCGYTVLEETLAKAPAGAMVYANFGKGVTFWGDDEVGTHFTSTYADVVSADNYWYTDPNICDKTEGGTRFEEPRDLTESECRLAANYGHTVKQIRDYIQPAGSKPVWGFVELGRPFSDEKLPTVTPTQIRAAVWQSLIAGARGIVYFNHSFSGQCASQHVLRDCDEESSTAVARINNQVSLLAPVLNSDTAEGILSAEGAVNVRVKVYENHFYVLAGSAQATKQTASFNLQCVGSTDVEVLNENRTLHATEGAFADDFADGNAIHVYKMPITNCAAK
ncbi:hypothetical protein [Arthrobacter sp. S41]|uniref:hypothetical protein n=1 Tax=Arthrobacter sp. S41 TaxID=2509721 RepID=UPI001036B863|nr:hypothetical protein [Arthrobacter sp. S41]TAP27083.1 hypothetical protein EYR88_01595 [Arthrobacter sp. S41]